MMDRNREARRASVVGSNGFNRRRHRLNSLRNSPDEDGGPELQESVRLRERVKKDRERDLRERSIRSKRRRADIIGDDTSEESVSDEDDEFAAVGFSSPPAGSTSTIHPGGGNNSSFSHQRNNHHLQHRKTFPPSSSSSFAMVVRAPPVWKPGDETITAVVPRKARSASTKRSHDRISSSNNSSNGDQNPPISPARHGHVPAAPVSPTSSAKKKPNNIDPKLNPPKSSSSSANPSSSNAEELEIEIAEVLYGLMTQSHDDPRETNRFNGDGKSLNSIPAPKRKRPMETPTPKCETSSPPKSERISGSTAENVSETGGVTVISQVPLKSKVADEESKDSKDLIIGVTEDVGASKEQEYPAGRNRNGHIRDPPLIETASPAPTNINANLSEVENPKEVKFEIDLMLPPPETKFDTSVVQGPVLSTLDAPVSKDNGGEKDKSSSRNNSSLLKGKVLEEEGEQNNTVELKDIRNSDLEKPERDISSNIIVNENKSKLTREDQPNPKPGSSKSSLPLTVPVDVGRVAPLQTQFSQPRPKRCATHCHIARNIHCMQQLTKMNPFWPSPISLSGSNDKVVKKQQSSNNVEKEKVSKPQQSMPPATPSNLLDPGFVFPINQNAVSASAPSSTSSPAPLSFNYPNETHYLAILQNNAYPFPIPGPAPNYRAGPPIFSGPFYPSQMMQAQHKHLQTQPNNSFSSQKPQPKPGGTGNDDNSHSSANDNRGSRSASMNIYGQNFALANNSNQADKKSGGQTHQQVVKTGAESLPPHTFAVTFGSGMDSASMAQAMQKKSSFWISQEAKSGDSANLDNFPVKGDERKSFGFGDVRPSIQPNNNAGPTMRNGSGAMNSVQNARTNNSSGTGNGSIYSENLGKFTNTVSTIFPQNLVQRSNSPTPQSPQWKTSTAPVSSIQTTQKNLPQQHSRNQPPMHSQISFGGNNVKQPKNTPSILGNSKAQMQQQENVQQSQLFFSGPYSQSPHLSSLGTGYFVPQRRPDQSQRPPSGVNTNDPATAIAAAAVNAKGGGFQTSGFSYIHPVPTGVRVKKSSEQKQPAGNDSLHQWQSEKK